MGIRRYGSTDPRARRIEEEVAKWPLEEQDDFWDVVEYMLMRRIITVMEIKRKGGPTMPMDWRKTAGG